MSLRLGSRASPLAQKQSQLAAEFLETHGIVTSKDLYMITTQGDKILGPLWQHKAGKSLFVKEIQQALLSKECDIAVHSLKDMSLETPDNTVIAALLSNASPFDAIIYAQDDCSLDTLVLNARVGTSSLRRCLQLHQRRPDLKFVPLRGNIETRLQQLRTSNLDAIVLAAAGLERLGIIPRSYEILSPDVMVPAFNQGLIGLECRIDNQALINQLYHCSDPLDWQRYKWERAIAQIFHASCHSAIGIYVIPTDNGGADVSVFAARSIEQKRFLKQYYLTLEEALKHIPEFFDLKTQSWALCRFEFS